MLFIHHALYIDQPVHPEADFMADRHAISGDNRTVS